MKKKLLELTIELSEDGTKAEAIHNIEAKGLGESIVVLEYLIGMYFEVCAKELDSQQERLSIAEIDEDEETVFSSAGEVYAILYQSQKIARGLVNGLENGSPIPMEDVSLLEFLEVVMEPYGMDISEIRDKIMEEAGEIEDEDEFVTKSEAGYN